MIHDPMRETERNIKYAIIMSEVRPGTTSAQLSEEYWGHRKCKARVKCLCVARTYSHGVFDSVLYNTSVIQYLSIRGQTYSEELDTVLAIESMPSPPRFRLHLAAALRMGPLGVHCHPRLGS